MDPEARNLQIEAQLAQEGIRDKNTVKLLLLGSGDSGKSTIAKQMKILHKNGFERAEIKNCHHLVMVNVFQSIDHLLKGAEQLKIPVVESNHEEIDHVRSFVQRKESEIIAYIDAYTALLIKKLWLSPSIQKCYKHRSQFFLLDSAKYFLDSIDRIKGTNFVPNAMDILRCRTPTTGVHEIQFIYKERNFRMVDVGGQRSERRKWIHCFDNVDAILFVAAMSDYDQILAEDATKNRMEDSLELFKEIVTNEYFLNTSILLFLNKKDLFEEKIQHSSFKRQFPKFKGNAQSFNETSEYLYGEFEKRNPPDRRFYCHFTNATDTKNIDVIFAACMDMILKDKMGSVGVF